MPRRQRSPRRRRNESELGQHSGAKGDALFKEQLPELNDAKQWPDLDPVTRECAISKDGMMTHVWGPLMWTSMHIQSMNFPLSPTIHQKRGYIRHWVSRSRTAMRALPAQPSRRSVDTTSRGRGCGGALPRARHTDTETESEGDARQCVPRVFAFGTSSPTRLS